MTLYNKLKTSFVYLLFYFVYRVWSIHLNRLILKLQDDLNLKLEYLLALDNHIETVGKENKEVTLKKIFEITRDIANLGFGEKDIHEIAKDEDLYIRYEEWRAKK